MSVIIGAFAYLWAVGLPLTIACLPSDRAAMAVLLAPITAICLISLGHQYDFYVFARPYHPLWVHSAAFLISTSALGAALWFRRVGAKATLQALTQAIRDVAPYSVVPLLGLTAFCAFFWSSGLEMLSAGEDEFGYLQISRQLMTWVHTGLPNDLPFGRADHYLADFVGRTMAYLPEMRFGANFLLADLSSASHLPLELAFPVLVGLFIVVATLSLPAALEMLFRLPRPMAIIGQIAFAAQALLVILHFQGSLSHLGSMAFRLIGLAVITWALAFSTSVGTLVLAVIFELGWLLMYLESIGFGLLLPILAVSIFMLRHLFRDYRYVLVYFARVGVLVGALAFLLPAPFEYMIELHTGKLQLGGVTHAWTWAELVSASQQTYAVLRNVLPPMLGLAGFYDQSAINQTFFLTRVAPLAPAVFLLLVAFAVIGFRRLPWELRLAYGSVVLSLGGIAVASAMRGDYFLCIRSSQMAIPFLWMGAACLISPPWLGFPEKPDATPATLRPPRPVLSIDSSWMRTALCATAAVFFAAVITSNAWAVWRSIRYVTSHTLETDPTIRHFNPTAAVWRNLRTELRSPNDAPVLLSGFDNTPVPHWLALAIDPLPQLLGDSVTRFWTIMSPKNSLGTYYGNMVTVQSADELHDLAKASPARHWDETYPRLLAATVKALVPVSGGYPVEWGRWQSLAGPLSVRVINVCDVIDRGDVTSMIIEGAPAAPSGSDALGAYWQLTGPVSAQPRLNGLSDGVVEVRYTGPAPHVSVSGAVIFGGPTSANVRDQQVLRLRGRYGPESKIMLGQDSETRLRAVTFYRLVAGADASERL